MYKRSDPFKQGEDFKLSRSKLEAFTQCPRCFYLDRRLKIPQPSGPAFTLNSAVDALLKKEFDIHRAKGSTHPLMKEYGIKAIPFSHENINIWRENFKGVTFYHEPTKLTISGAIDDIWQDDSGKLFIVDYKATSTTAELSLDTEYRQAYKRQMEIYQWLFRRNGFDISDIGYFVYANGRKDKEAFDGKLEFDVQIITYHGNDSWVEKTIIDARKCLDSDDLPQSSPTCQFCEYRKKAVKVEE
ncbi:MAG: PD-(D/E)XK nuclease family protein [Candidatus Paceibacterota bacterium]|jgi:RecB family exonuclease